MNTKLEQLEKQRIIVAHKILELQKERKRLNNAISQVKHREKQKKV